jgi:hypothetical protein
MVGHLLLVELAPHFHLALLPWLFHLLQLLMALQPARLIQLQLVFLQPLRLQPWLWLLPLLSLVLLLLQLLPLPVVPEYTEVHCGRCLALVARQWTAAAALLPARWPSIACPPGFLCGGWQWSCCQLRLLESLMLMLLVSP